MSWGGAITPRIQRPAPTEPTPVSSGGSAPVSSAPPAAEDPSVSTGMINLDLTQPNAVSAYQPKEGATFGGGPVGDVLGFATSVAGKAIGLAGDAAHGIDKIVGLGLDSSLGSPATSSQYRVLQMFSQAEDSPEKQAAAAQMVAAGGDQFKQAQIAFDYLDKHEAYLMPELITPSDTTGSGIAMHMLGMLQAPQQVIERTSAGIFGNINLDPLKMAGGFGGVSNVRLGGRIADIQMRLANPATAGDVNPTEKWAADQVNSGQWTNAQALDFLAGHGAGFSNDMVSEMTGALMTDPTIVLPIAGEVAKGTAVVRDIVDLAEGGNRAANAVLTTASRANDLFDPLGAIWGRAPKPDALAPDLVKSLVDAGHAADPATRYVTTLSAGYHSAYNYPTRLYGLMAQLDQSGQLLSDFKKAVGTSIANMGRRTLLRRQMAAELVAGDPGRLIRDRIVPDDLIGELEKRPPKNFSELVERDALEVMKPVETPEDKALLSERLARSFGQTPDYWAAEMGNWSKEELSFMHAQTYANEDIQLLGAAQRMIDQGVTISDKSPRRLTLLNAGTLTMDDSARILRGIESADSAEAAAQILRDAQTTFRNLRFVTLDATGPALEDQVGVLRNWLEDRIFKADLPAEINQREITQIAQHEPGLAEMHQRGLTGSAPWKLGMAPAEDARWGLVQDSEGNWHSQMDVWSTHVAATTSGYQPISMPLRFVDGRIAGFLSNKLADAVDSIENATRVFTHSVTSALVTENTRVRLLTGLRAKGFTQDEASRLSNGLFDMVSRRQAPVRSLGAHDIWSEVGSLVPARLKVDNGFTQSDLMGQIMRAYQGDFRYVGGTQYLTGGLKRVTASSNTIGILAERVVPFLRFSASPIFQAQMRVEGIFWNVLRGVIPAFGSTPNEVDAMAARILQKLAETSGRRSGDLDSVVEMSQQAMMGRELATLGSDRWGQTFLQKVTNAKGAEQLNFLRMFQHELAAGWRDVAAAHGFNLDEVLAHIRGEAEGVSRWGDSAVGKAAMSDDEATVRWLHEMMVEEARPDAVVQPGAKVVNAGVDASVYKPTNIGELRPIDVDGFLHRAPITVGGREIKTAAGLRQAMYRREITSAQLTAHLRDLNVPAENIDRFQNAISFDWNVFWRNAAKKFGATKDEVTRLQDMVASAARRQRMSPSDFLSQVISPTVGNGPDALVNHIGDGLSTLRAMTEGGITADDLARQLAKVFSANLHPSAQETLLEEFGRAVGEPWDNVATDRLAQEVMVRARGEIPEPGAVNPEVERLYREFSAFTERSIANNLLKGKDITPEARDLLDRIGLIPKDYATPYNKSQAMMINSALDYMAQKENDAFSLIYWRRSRSFAERTINHPLFGIYPASYMWGKVAPGYIRFLAKDPFGLETGAGLNALRNVQMSLAARREFDPRFQAELDKGAKSELLWFIGYLLPGAPWDLGAAAPAWVQEMLNQADSNAKRVANGTPAAPLNIDRVVSSESNFMNPARGLSQGLSAASEVERGVESLVKGALPQPAPPAPVDYTQPIHVANLQPVLSPAIQQLQQELLQ